MMIDQKTVRHIATLSRLQLTEEEEESARRDLSRILEYMDKLNELDTTGVEPTFAAPRAVENLRADEAKPSYPNEALMANAPESEGGAYKVPNVVEE